MSQRKRIIFNNEVVFVGPHDTNGIVSQILGVQESDCSITASTSDIKQISNNEVLCSYPDVPSVTANFTYILANGGNEETIGLNTNGSLSIANLREKNIFFVTNNQGDDAIGNSLSEAISLGNCLLTNYTVSMSIGELPTATTSWECLNGQFGSASSIGNPSVSVSGDSLAALPGSVTPPPAVPLSSVFIVRPFDIKVEISSELGGGGPKLNGENAIFPQNITLSLDMQNRSVFRLGNPFPYSRNLQLPCVASLSIEANLLDLSAGNLLNEICDASTLDITVTYLKPCADDGENVISFQMKKATFKGVDTNLSVDGEPKTATISFECKMSNLSSTDKGLFIIGA